MRIDQVICVVGSMITGWGMGMVVGTSFLRGSFCYLPYNNRTGEDLTNYFRCGYNLINSIGVMPDDPGAVNFCFNAMTLSCAAAGLAVGLGFTIRCKQANSYVTANIIYSSDIVNSWDVDSEEKLYMIQVESKEEKQALIWKPLVAAEERSRFKTTVQPEASYEMDNGDLNFLKKNEARLTRVSLFKTKYAQDDIELEKIPTHKRRMR